MKRRPDCLPSETYKVTTECGSFYVIVGTDNDSIYEIKMELGKTGNCQRGFLHLISVLLSEKIQKSEDSRELKKFIKRHLEKFSCGCPFIWRGENYKSCIDYASKKILEKVKEEETKK